MKISRNILPRFARPVVMILSGLSIALLGACSFATRLPEPSTMSERIARIPTRNAPTDGPIKIRFNEHQIPFIEASSDIDGARGLGMVHAHLRLGQMEILRRVSQGRVSEMAGPFTRRLDEALRIFDFGRAADALERGLSKKSREWVDGFCEGINFYLENVEELPPEFALLGFEREPWTRRDVLTLVRLFGADVNWIFWLGALREQPSPLREALWRERLASRSDGVTSFEVSDEELSRFNEIVSRYSKSGSNAVVVSGSRTESGAAILASDPHLGIFFPNIWLAAGMKTPSYHAVGLMLPGGPFIALGRNEHIAWGGTNMRTMSSTFYDVSGLKTEEFTEEKMTIPVRWWFDGEVSYRRSPFGPVLSDASIFSGTGEQWAVRWVGHEPSDEIGAFLAMSRATNFTEFREAFSTYRVSAQNFLYSDREGNIGQVLAMGRPVYGSAAKPTLLNDPEREEDTWKGILTPLELPNAYNPDGGFIASANNIPVKTDYPLGLIYSSSDRVARMQDRLTRHIADGNRVDVAFMKDLQLDVYSASSHKVATLLAEYLKEEPLALSTDGERLVQTIAAWDGRYDRDSLGATAFEVLMASVMPSFIEATLDTEGRSAEEKQRIVTHYLRGEQWKQFFFTKWNTPARERLRKLLPRALHNIAGRRVLPWGEHHRTVVGHPLSRIPLLGSKYVFGEIPGSGSGDTLLKSGHPLSKVPVRTTFGSNSRLIFDLASPDANQVVLLGGQDGFMRSDTSVDQLDEWVEGRYIPLPLSNGEVQRTFRTVVTIAP